MLFIFVINKDSDISLVKYYSVFSVNIGYRFKFVRFLVILYNFLYFLVINFDFKVKKVVLLFYVYFFLRKKEEKEGY